MLNLTTEQITEYNANHTACRGLGRYLYRTGQRMTLYTDWYWELTPEARKAVQEGWEGSRTITK